MTIQVMSPRIFLLVLLFPADAIGFTPPSSQRAPTESELASCTWQMGWSEDLIQLGWFCADGRYITNWPDQRRMEADPDGIIRGRIGQWRITPDGWLEFNEGDTPYRAKLYWCGGELRGHFSSGCKCRMVPSR